MNFLYFDSSALVKRYLTEIGSTWILARTDLVAGTTIVVSEITRVEVAAAFAARHRASGGISRQERDDALNLLLRHFDTEYQIASLDRVTISRAVNLTQTYRLRGYDAIQLATALATNQALTAAGLPGLTFIAADDDLLAAAQREGLATNNPNHQP
ncbi:MAG: type II toxin-antitoxin system VapC family toxin [Anaerolineales bacterium]|nr:type II toxin-antitoxin system VapC family toxin [Anaerolineales bacterium]